MSSIMLNDESHVIMCFGYVVLIRNQKQNSDTGWQQFSTAY